MVCVVEDMRGATWQARDDETIVRALAVRYQRDANAFWLSHGNKMFPTLGIWIVGGLSALHYLPDEEGAHPGFRAIGAEAALDLEATTDFYMTDFMEPEVTPNKFVVRLEIAIAAAKEFRKCANLPVSSVEWFEL